MSNTPKEQPRTPSAMDIEKMRAALREAWAVIALCNTRDFDAPEDDEVRGLGERIGYGAVMAAASKTWASKMRREGFAGSQHTCGPCEATVTRTLAIITDALGHPRETPGVKEDKHECG